MAARPGLKVALLVIRGTAVGGLDRIGERLFPFILNFSATKGWIKKKKHSFSTAALPGVKVPFWVVKDAVEGKQ